MTSYTEYLDQRIHDSIPENDAECIIAAKNKDKKLVERIENFRKEKMTDDERANHSADAILERIQTDSLVRAFFRKDTTRQTIHEKTQIEWIKIHKYPDAYKMNADTGGICLSEHKKITICKDGRPSGATKSFDVHVPSENIYAVLKHTTTAGGAQDNQYRDVKHFIIQSVGYLTENPGATEKFFFYLDGKYYTQKKHKELCDMVPIHLRERIVITNCQSIVPA